MTQLMVHGRKVETVFELLGNDENAMTYSLGWALAKCAVFHQAVAKLLGIQEGFSEALYSAYRNTNTKKGLRILNLSIPASITSSLKQNEALQFRVPHNWRSMQTGCT